MRPETRVRRLVREFGELLEPRDGGADLETIRERYRDDPCGFIEDVLGGVLLDYKRDMALSVRATT
jgi:hypothetical protein